MKVLTSWLQDYVEIKLSDDELAEKITTISGADVDAINKTLDDNIIVAVITEVKPHPNADRLRLAEVNTSKENLEIVCGAPNITAGQKVPLALIGAKVSGHEITKTNIRGVESSGMLCSEKELGIGEDHSGIKILPEDAKLGESVSKYLPSDTIFDLEITPNRGDCLSHLGIAREIAAFTSQQIKHKSVEVARNGESEVEVRVIDLNLCPRYYAQEIRNVKIGPSPQWLLQRLALLGVKPINNIVDVTNYIMLGLGQPLHAFDMDKVAGKSILVRLAEAGESITTLDGKSRTLDDGMLVIADQENPIALAGIMGGSKTGVTENTTNIILEAAEFDRRNIRKTSKVLGLSSDASYRFERGIDSQGVEDALNQATQLILEIAGGEAIGEPVKVDTGFNNKILEIPYEKINNLLGLDLENDKIDSILESLGFEIPHPSLLPSEREKEQEEPPRPVHRERVRDNRCEALVPSWRHDIEIWQDLAEEVGRMYGYNKIPEFPVPPTAEPLNSNYNLAELIKDLLTNLGFVEVKNYPFLSEADISAAKISTDELLEVANPVQSENKYLRNSTTPSLIKNIARNSGFDPVMVFEIGNVFSKNDEKTLIGVAAAGKNALEVTKSASSAIIDLTDLPKDFVKITELSQDEISRFKVRKAKVYAFEIPIAELLEHLNVPKENLPLQIPSKEIEFRPVSQYPSINRDIAMIVDAKIGAEIIKKSIYEISPLIILVELFDEFSSTKFGQGKKSLAFHIFLQHLERTLTDKEADDVIAHIISMLKEKYGAEIR